MMKITLEGVAGKRFGREHNLAVRNPNEALRALCQLIPGFREFLTCAHEYGIFFQVITNNQDKVDYEGLGLSCNSFSLVPVITGALNFSFKNLGLILVGALLVAASMGAFGRSSADIGGCIWYCLRCCWHDLLWPEDGSIQPWYGADIYRYCRHICARRSTRWKTGRP